MANVGKWTGGVTSSNIPTTSWAAPPVNIFSTEVTNNGYTLSNHVLTLPSTNLANGYLVVGAFEHEGTHNNRHNPQARFLYTGSGNSAGGYSSGYMRDNSEDRAYCRAWAFVHNPSPSDTFTFQWRRDANAPAATDGTVRSELQVIPLFYSDVGIFTSTSNSCPGGTVPNQVTGFSGTNGTNINLASNVVTVSGDNKKYLCLGGYYWQGIGNARTQRWGGFRVDGTKDDSSKGYSYARNSSNADIGEIFSTILETSTADRTIDMFVYRGDGISNLQGGADVDGNTTGSNANHSIVVLELNDTAEVFYTKTDGNSFNLDNTSGVTLDISPTSEFNGSASFTRASNGGVNVNSNMDVLLGADISAASNNVGTGARWTGYAELTINGVTEPDTFAGDYLRNNQGSQDTFGWSANILSSISVSTNEDLGVDVTALTGTEGGGDAISPAGWTGFWGINLDTLEDTGGGTDVSIGLGLQNIYQTLNSVSTTTTTSITATIGAVSLALGLNTATASTTGGVTVDLSSQSYSITEQSLSTSLGSAVNLGLINYTEALQSLGVSTGTSTELGSLNYLVSLNSLSVSTSGATIVNLNSQNYTLQENSLNVSTGSSVDLTSFNYTLQQNNVETATGSTVSLDSLDYSISQYAISTTISGGVVVVLNNQGYSLEVQSVNVGTGLSIGINNIQLTKTLNALTTSLGQGVSTILNNQQYTLNLNDLQAFYGSSFDLGLVSYVINQNSLLVTTVSIIPHKEELISTITKEVNLVSQIQKEVNLISTISQFKQPITQLTNQVELISQITTEFNLISEIIIS